MKLLSLILPPLLLASVAQASGKDVGNGGDICEDRIKSIRDDISSWIQRGGSSGLRLPSGVSVVAYDAKMQNAMLQGSVECTSQVIKINGQEKTCENIDQGGRPLVICNNSRFAQTSESDQYVLIHHEYAGLAGLEVNDADGSNYVISNQISEYLTDQIVKKLSIKPNPDQEQSQPKTPFVKIKFDPVANQDPSPLIANLINQELANPNSNLAQALKVYSEYELNTVESRDVILFASGSDIKNSFSATYFVPIRGAYKSQDFILTWLEVSVYIPLDGGDKGFITFDRLEEKPNP